MFFVEVKHLFSTKSEIEIFSKLSWIETEANGDHWGDRTHPVSGSSILARDTRASHRRVRSSPRETAKHARLIGHGDASGHDRSDASGCAWMLTGL
jgi:hypothetical protein